MVSLEKTKLAIRLSDLVELLEENSFVQRAFLSDLKSSKWNDEQADAFSETLQSKLSSGGKNRWKDVSTLLQQTVLTPTSQSVTELLTDLAKLVD